MQAAGDSRRTVVLALMLAPFLLFGGAALWRAQTSEPVFPGLQDAGEVARIEIARGTEQVVLARRGPAWVLLSADDAPGDAARIAATLRELGALRGAPLPDGAPPPRREGLGIKLLGANGGAIGHALFWTDEASVLPGERRLAIAKAPALPLWPSAWSSLRPPAIAADSIVSARRITPAGAADLPPADVATLGRLLAGLSAADFVPARTVNWAGADYVQATTRDGAVIEVQSVLADDGRHHVRLTSEQLAEVRARRHFAFRMEPALP